MPKPQSFQSEYAPRLRGHLNAFLTPVIPPSTSQVGPASRTTKRGTVVINYSEDLLNDDDEDSEGPRRYTGLRGRREDPSQAREALIEKLSKELTAPVEVQGIWREWMGKPKFGRLVQFIS
jgi:chromatin structure-remodeling complex subunit SFH1